jgi:hypothetical protein
VSLVHSLFPDPSGAFGRQSGKTYNSAVSVASTMRDLRGLTTRQGTTAAA